MLGRGCDLAIPRGQVISLSPVSDGVVTTTTIITITATTATIINVNLFYSLFFISNFKNLLLSVSYIIFFT